MTPTSTPPTPRLTPTEIVAIATPFVGGLLGAGAIVLSLAGKEKPGQILLGVWAVLTAFGGAAVALSEIENRRREQARWAQLGY